MVGCESLFHINGLDSNSIDFVESLYDVCMVWCLLCEKLGKKCCTIQPTTFSFFCNNCLAKANILNKLWFNHFLVYIGHTYIHTYTYIHIHTHTYILIVVCYFYSFLM